MRNSGLASSKGRRDPTARGKSPRAEDSLSFHARAIGVIKRIPRGRVATYGMIAALAGNPRAARQVVRTLNAASGSERLPWHRVINRAGQIVLKPGRGFELQRALLRDEGVNVSGDGHIDLTKYVWRPRTRRR